MADDSTLDALRAALDRYVDPYLGETLGNAHALRDVSATATGYTARIALGFPVGGYRSELTDALARHLAAAGIPAALAVELESDIRSHAVQRNLKPLEQIKNVVAVASGKGGVGKSTVAVNLALAWAAQGARVAVIVPTPQDIALADARKGLKMFEKVAVPVLGVVENMSIYVCSNCGHAEHIFGAGGGARMAQQYGVKLLGELPLDARIREEAD